MTQDLTVRDFCVHGCDDGSRWEVNDIQCLTAWLLGWPGALKPIWSVHSALPASCTLCLIDFVTTELLPGDLHRRLHHSNASFIKVPSMAVAEDPASVLELFVHDVANLPAEITHLYEEMQAKDVQIQECRSTINARDSSIQKFIKLNSSMVKNPKEDGYAKTIVQNYEKAQLLQEEKITLSEKAAALVSFT